MKLLIKTISFGVICLISIVISLYLVNVNIITDEINKATYIAMSCVQNDIQNLIKERNVNHTSYTYDYDKKFKSYFMGLCSKYDIYDIKTYGDDQKGIIYVEVDPKVKLVKPKRLISIVDELIEDNSGDYKDKINVKSSWNPKINQVLYTWNVPSPYQVKSWHIDIDAIDLGTGAYYKYYEPKMTLTCEYDGNTSILATTPGRNGRLESMEINMIGSASNQEIGCKCKKIILSAERIPTFLVRMDYMTVGSTGDTSITYASSSKKVTSFARYIDERMILDENSIWLNDEYKSVLENIVGIYSERNN